MLSEFGTLNVVLQLEKVHVSILLLRVKLFLQLIVLIFCDSVLWWAARPEPPTIRMEYLCIQPSYNLATSLILPDDIDVLRIATEIWNKSSCSWNAIDANIIRKLLQVYELCRLVILCHASRRDFARPTGRVRWWSIVQDLCWGTLLAMSGRSLEIWAVILLLTRSRQNGYKKSKWPCSMVHETRQWRSK